jgi:hypothetical protein
VSETLALIEAAVREINDAGTEDAFGTFEVEGEPNLWLQYLPGNINAAYPFKQAPEAMLAELKFDGVIEWKPEEFAAVELVRPPEQLAVWIDRYFREILNCPPDYALTWRREQ